MYSSIVNGSWKNDSSGFLIAYSRWATANAPKSSSLVPYWAMCRRM
jgi:hypothetical protein